MKTPDIFAPMAEAFVSGLGRAAIIRDAGETVAISVTAIIRSRNEDDLFGAEGAGMTLRRDTVAFRTVDAPDAAEDWTIEDSADGTIYSMHDLADDGRGMTRGTLRDVAG